MHGFGVYASRWPLGAETVWTIVNRNGYDVAAQQMDVALTPGMRYFDLYHGLELKPALKPETQGNNAVLSFDIEAQGYGAILATPGEPRRRNQDPDERMAAMTRKPLPDFSHQPAILSPDPRRNPAHRAGRRRSRRNGENPRRRLRLPGTGG